MVVVSGDSILSQSGSQSLERSTKIFFVNEKLNPKISHDGSMYAIYGNIYHQYTPNVSICTTHGSYGKDIRMNSEVQFFLFSLLKPSINPQNLDAFRSEMTRVSNVARDEVNHWRPRPIRSATAEMKSGGDPEVAHGGGMWDPQPWDWGILNGI